MEPFSHISVNKDQANLLLKGLKSLPTTEQTNINYTKLVHDLETITVVWDRRIKNQKIAHDIRRKTKIAAQKDKSDQRLATLSAAPLPKV